MKYLDGLNNENVLYHMVLWGATCGLFLGVLYILLHASVAFFRVTLEPEYVLQLIRQVLMVGWVAATLGGLTGLILGGITGALMSVIKRLRFLSLEKQKRISYGVILLLMTVICLLFTADLGPEFAQVAWSLIIAPAIVATATMLLAAERHFKQFEAQKPKQKRTTASV